MLLCCTAVTVQTCRSAETSAEITTLYSSRSAVTMNGHHPYIATIHDDYNVFECRLVISANVFSDVRICMVTHAHSSKLHNNVCTYRKHLRMGVSDNLTDVMPDVVGGWDDVEVGFLLGRGSSGSVYRAKWNGQHVAVKVRHVSVDRLSRASGQIVLCQ